MTSFFRRCPANLAFLALSSIDEKRVDKKNRIHENALRFVYNDKNSTLKELFTKDKSVTLYDRSIQVFVAKMFKVKEPFS